jgi:hypothetical protein
MYCTVQYSSLNVTYTVFHGVLNDLEPAQGLADPRVAGGGDGGRGRD